MNYRTQLLSIGSLALLCVLATSGCKDIADTRAASDISTGRPSRIQTDEKIFEPSMATMSRRPESNPERNVYYGDLHVHTEYSFDAFAFGTMATPRDAYRYAKGEAILHPVGYEIQLSRPLDFYAVTDHAMFLGAAKEAADTTTALSKLSASEIVHDLNAPDNRGLFSLATRAKVFGKLGAAIIEAVSDGEIEQQDIDDIAMTAWRDTINAADEANIPGRFTAFAGYEYTSSTSERGNLHRNVIFRGSDNLPELPFSRLNSRNPEGLWDWMDTLRAQGIESLAIPHNSNGSNGAMFMRTNWAGEPIDER